MNCKKGEIIRKSYTKKNGTKVKATCIKDIGAPGKGLELIGPLKKGTLRKFGYSTKESIIKRHNSLLKAVKGLSFSSVIHKLNAVKVLTKKSNPVASQKFSDDMKWLQSKK